MPFERHVFRQLVPTQRETAHKFMVHLRKQAHSCNFGEALNENLRDQLIEKLPDFQLRKKLLEVKDISFKATLDKVRRWEASNEQANQMVTPVRELGASANMVEKPSGHGFGRKHCKTYFKLTEIAQLDVESVVIAINMAIMLTLAKEEETQSREFKAQPNNEEADNDTIFKEDKPILWGVLSRTQVRMTDLLFL